MRIPVHIIREKKRREEAQRRREEGRRIPMEVPQPEVRPERPAPKDSRRHVIVIQL